MDRQHINNESCWIILTILINYYYTNYSKCQVKNGLLELQFRINQRIIIKNEYMQQLENMT